MKPFNWLVTIFLLAASPAGLAYNDGLREAIGQAHWSDALRHYQGLPVEKSIPVLKALSENNVVMAQWFLADALARTGKPEEATKWLYTASLGTRMDSTICRVNGADAVEYRFVHVFAPQFNPLRANDDYRREGLIQALRFHSTRLGGSAHPDWACKMVDNEAPRKALTLTTSDNHWEKTRHYAYTQYQRQSGLGKMRSPDLIRINPVR